MTVGLYAGSFDPPTLGHLDIIQRSAAQLDKLIVGIGINPNKKAFLPNEERAALLVSDCKEQGITNVVVTPFTGATVDFAKEMNVSVLIRGLRGEGDIPLERGMAEVNRTNGFDTLFLLARSTHSHLSSQLVREVVAAGLSTDELVSARVAASLMHHGAIRQRPPTAKISR